MTLQEFKEKHPELYAEVHELGVKDESTRLKAIDKILKPELAEHFVDLKYDGKSTAEQIELAQYRKIEELRDKDAKKLELHKKNNDADGVALGHQVLDMGLGGDDADNNEEAKKIAAEKLENEEDEDAFFSGCGVRKNG